MNAFSVLQARASAQLRRYVEKTINNEAAFSQEIPIHTAIRTCCWVRRCIPPYSLYPFGFGLQLYPNPFPRYLLWNRVHNRAYVFHDPVGPHSCLARHSNQRRSKRLSILEAMGEAQVKRTT